MRLLEAVLEMSGAPNCAERGLTRQKRMRIKHLSFPLLTIFIHSDFRERGKEEAFCLARKQLFQYITEACRLRVLFRADKI